MTAPTPYLLLPGTARAALEFYATVFGGVTELHTYAEFGRTDGDGALVAHGRLLDAPVAVFAADTGDGERPLAVEGLLFSLLGADEPEVLRRWFAALADGGRILDDLQERPWGGTDGQVVDRFGVPWLLGYEA